MMLHNLKASIPLPKSLQRKRKKGPPPRQNLRPQHRERANRSLPQLKVLLLKVLLLLKLKPNPLQSLLHPRVMKLSQQEAAPLILDPATLMRKCPSQHLLPRLALQATDISSRSLLSSTTTIRTP